MKLNYNLPDNLSLNQKISIIEDLKSNCIDSWCERIHFTKTIKSNLPYIVFLNSLKGRDNISFQMVKDFERELHYGKVLIKFSIKEDYFVFVMDFSLSYFKQLIQKLNLIASS